MKSYRTGVGSRYPAGSTYGPQGTNFSVFSRHAVGMELLLYESSDSPSPFQVIKLDPEENRTFFFWHVFVEGLPEGIHYTWRADGPDDTRGSGFRFDREKELVDPWASAVTHDVWDRRAAAVPGNGHLSMRAIVVDDSYDWEGDRPLNHLPENAVIYEMHVGGFTRHPSAKVTHPGTFAAVIEKIPHLKELGITDVELMPIMAFDEQDVPPSSADLGLTNYWGYSTHSFFSPHPGYCISARDGSREFRDMVKALHKAGIGVILDIAVNHTAEGGRDGPVINFKGLGNETFYHLDPRDRSIYLDFTGCGNTVNCNHPLVATFLVRCLEYWVREMHVDGFRFNLASVLARGEDSEPMRHPPVLWSIEFSRELADTRIIAEAWDAAGLYQVGAFPGFRWAEWNGRYRDVMRRFVRGDGGLIGEVATRLCGSSDLYQSRGRLPTNSVHFITCHDGFTLYDLVSYNKKHNESNGEDNRDGTDDNLSWNCGHEGETTDPEILALRIKQAKNFMALLLLSQGVPMILSGDEVLRTQRGNNNGYCQDNELSWFDWNLTEKNRDFLRFVKEMIAFRKRHPCLRRTRFFKGMPSGDGRLADIGWHGTKLNDPDWHDPQGRILAFTLAAAVEGEEDVHVILNMSDTSRTMPLPSIPDRPWHKAVDTGAPSHEDIVRVSRQVPVRDDLYDVSPRSVVVFESRPHGWSID